MDQVGSWILAIVESSGLFAPMMFIGFHLLRPLFFLPVAFICVSGGILFGLVSGAIYSVIGITLSSILFYRIVKIMPRTVHRLARLRQKLFGEHAQITRGQIILLRLMPFIHFHLLSLCIIEMSKGFKEYFRLSFASNVPLAVVYTSFGQWISTMSPMLMAMIISAFLPFLYFLRKKEIVLKWEDFFQRKTAPPNPMPLKNRLP
ncbi:TVP38/TMEM64 family protein [Salirhabdus salicampi]|uniref:TVP38/TMEM64 family protein n=1 Tax=Salirhabdus salicampi TaxID=476102 RepID=UPI0020C47D5F|nr:VTT domain-containing protein [Salirhabdus salicampi]MCP8617071.1 VTT domain-containing protein [Salirhabdus salicampi]